MRVLVVTTRHVGDITSGADLRLVSHLRPLLDNHEFCLLHATPHSSIPKDFSIDLNEIFGNRIRTVKELGFDWRSLLRPPGPMAIPAHPVAWRRAVAAAAMAFSPDVLHADMLQACLVTPAALRPNALAFGQDSFARFSSTRRSAEPSVLRQCVFALDAQAYGLYERVYRHFGISVFLSREDIEAAGAQENALLIGNGVDILTPDHLPEAPVLFFGGNLEYLPNREGIFQFTRTAFPLLTKRHPGARLIIAGRSPDAELQALASASVEVVANPVCMSSVMRRAQIVICPVSWGAGQKNKVLEAAAAARPIVCDPHMVEGSDFEAGSHLLTARSAEEWVEVISELFTSPALRESLRQAAHLHVRDSYSWERGARKLEGAYVRLVTGEQL